MESEETISASAPANSPPDTPHELNNDKDLKEANENGKLKPSPRSIFGSKGNALKSLQPESVNEKSPKSPILKKLHKSTVTPPQPRIFSLADPNFTFISYPQNNNGNDQNLGRFIQDLSNVRNGFTDKGKGKKEKRGKCKQPETNGYNNYSSTSSCHPDLLKDAIEYVSPKGKKKDANHFDFLKNFDDSKTPSSTNEFIPDGIDFVLPIEQHNGTEHSTPKLASPNHDNGINNHDINGFSDEASQLKDSSELTSLDTSPKNELEITGNGKIEKAESDSSDYITFDSGKGTSDASHTAPIDTDTMKNAENNIGNHSNNGTTDAELNNSGQAKTSTTSLEIWSESENEEPEPKLENIFKTTLEEAENSENQKCYKDSNGTLVCEWNGGKKSEKNKSHEIIELEDNFQELENEIHTTTSEIQPEPEPVSWRGNLLKGEKNLAMKDTHRFNLELASNDKWEPPIEGQTDKYDTFHFEEGENDSDDMKKYFLKVFHKDVCLTNEIASVDNVENNSIILINYQNNNKTKFKKILQKDEEYFQTMSNLIKRPVRFLMFKFGTRGYLNKKLTIKCEDNVGNNDNIVEFDVEPEITQASNNDVYYESPIVKTKICPNDEYFIKIESRLFNFYRKMECDPAIFENNYLNVYAIKQTHQGATCKLDKKGYVQINNTHGYINNLNHFEQFAEGRINLAIEKSKKVVMAPTMKNFGGIKIGENKGEKNKGKIPSGNINQNQDVQGKGKGKMIESDNAMEDNNANINEKNEDAVLPFLNDPQYHQPTPEYLQQPGNDPHPQHGNYERKGDSDKTPDKVKKYALYRQISWRGYQIEEEKDLASKNTHRFNVELNSDKWHLPTDGETDKYDTFHFEEVEKNNAENLEKYSLKVYKALDDDLITEIVSIDNVEDNSLIYIKYEGKNKTSIIKILKKDEEYFNTIIDVIKRPVRFLQFIFNTKACEEGVVTIKCKNEDNNDKIAEINIPERERMN
uniref:Uncharacterized protein n=1 Tax=Meloidogyne floridensis TaxID=298350 RepID=A0A915P860_9BILA